MRLPERGTIIRLERKGDLLGAPYATALRMLREAREAIPGLDARDKRIECARYREAASFCLDGDYVSTIAMLAGRMPLATFPERPEAQIIRFPGA